MRKLKNTLKPFALHEELKKRFPDHFRPGLVYHYTTKDVLFELTKGDSKLFATYFRTLNDNQEYNKGLSYVLENYLPQHNKDILKLLKPYIEDDDEWLKRETPNKPILFPWVMSLSRSADSLYQWRAYTDPDDGGVAIGFDFEELEKLTSISVSARRARKDSDPTALAYELHFLPCLYLDEESKEDVARANKILDFLFKEWYEVRKKEAGFTKREDCAVLALVVANLFALITKNASFRDEHEVRLVLFLKDPKYFGNISFVGGKPRIEIPLPRDTGIKVNSLIKKVIISPHGDKCMLRSIVDMAAIKNGLNYKIKRSVSSFNGR